jgi:hypothetical protein
MAFFLIMAVLLVPFANPSVVKAQTSSTVVTTKTITPSCALPGQSLTVTINVGVTGGGGVPGPVDTSLILDRTGSMYGQKFLDTKAAAKTYVDAQNDQDRAEVVSFSEIAKDEQDMIFMNTSGKSTLKKAIDNIIPPYGLTNLYAGLNESVQDFLFEARPDSRKAIILLTDGRPTVGITAASKFAELARTSAAANIAVYTIGLGPSDPYNQETINATLLQEIAAAGNGTYYPSPTSDQLEAIYLQISTELHQPPPATNIRVTENLPTSILTYNNDATQAPNSTSSGVIFWQIPLISAGTSWSVTFTVTALRRVAVVQSLSPTTIIYDRADQIGIRADVPPSMTVREVSTLSITASRTTAAQSDIVNYTATIANLGLTPETFNVGLFANTSSIGSTSVNLANGTSTVVHFSWNTSSFSPGIYDISITADPGRTIGCDESSNNTKTTTLTLASKSQAAIFPLLLPILLAIALIPIVAAAILGRRRRILPGAPTPCPPAGTVTSGSFCRMVCPRCYAPLTYSANYQKWYCPSCRRYV